MSAHDLLSLWVWMVVVLRFLLLYRTTLLVIWWPTPIPKWTHRKSNLTAYRFHDANASFTFACYCLLDSPIVSYGKQDWSLLYVVVYNYMLFVDATTLWNSRFLPRFGPFRLHYSPYAFRIRRVESVFDYNCLCDEVCCKMQTAKDHK